MLGGQVNLEEMKSLSKEQQFKIFKRLHEVRHQAKQVNYSASYGISPGGIVRNTGMDLKAAEL